MRDRTRAYQTTTTATSARNGSAAQFITSQPAADTSAPDENDDSAIVENTMKSLAPCVRDFSAGVYASVSSVVPPVYMKFQPAPISTSAATKWPNVTPVSAIAAPQAITTTPARITLSTPKRLMRLPVTNPGAYIPTTCHEMTIAASE